MKIWVDDIPVKWNSKGKSHDLKKKKRTGMLKEGKEYWSNLKVIWTGEVALITDSF